MPSSIEVEAPPPSSRSIDAMLAIVSLAFERDGFGCARVVRLERLKLFVRLVELAVMCGGAWSRFLHELGITTKIGKRFFLRPTPVEVSISRA